MRDHWKVRLRKWICSKRGCRPEGQPTPYGWTFCGRCGYAIAPKEAR